jgi:hypothetical protein
MHVLDLAAWLKERNLDLHWSWTPDGEVCLTAVRDDSVWNGTAADVQDAILLLQLSVDSNWGRCA